jgi:hypothetical protein
MSHSGDHSVNPQDEEEQGVVQSESQKRTRGPTTCKTITEKKLFKIEFKKDGCPTGENRAHYSTWCSLFAKRKADIRAASWRAFSKETKQEWWEMVKVMSPFQYFF